MMDYKWTEMFFNNAIVFAETYRKYLAKIKIYEKFRNVAHEDHIYEYYKMLAYRFRGRAEGIRHIILCVPHSREKMEYLDKLLED